MSTSYNVAVIQSFADKLYARAARVTGMWTMIGGLAGMAAGAAMAASQRNATPTVVLGLVVGAVVGAMIGRSRAFALRLQAQTALCQAQVEANTRATYEATRALAAASERRAA